MYRCDLFETSRVIGPFGQTKHGSAAHTGTMKKTTQDRITAFFLLVGLLATGIDLRASPLVDPPGWAKIDGRWYAWNGEVLVDPSSATIYGSALSAYNCIRPGGAPPSYADFVIELGSGASSRLYYMKTFAIDTDANTLVMTSATGDVVCAGSIAGPQPVETPIFKSSFE